MPRARPFSPEEGATLLQSHYRDRLSKLGEEWPKKGLNQLASTTGKQRILLGQCWPDFAVGLDLGAQRAGGVERQKGPACASATDLLCS